jgi:hypothetical protein
MPNFGISKLRSDMAVTNPALRPKVDVEKVFPRFRIEMAMSGGGLMMSVFVPFLRNHELLDGSRASYILCSSNTARHGHRKILN